MAQDTGTVIPFPSRTNVDRLAMDAVHTLARAQIITEREAVRALEDLGCIPDEIDLLRVVYALKRNRL